LREAGSSEDRRSFLPHPPLLEVAGLTLRFGGVHALDDVSLRVGRGEIFAIIGPNGAGKTSLLNALSGLYRPERGSIRFFADGEGAEPLELLRLRPHAIARLGIARSFQNIELFRHMTVLDNLMLGRHVRMRGNALSCALYWGPQRREEIAHRRAVEEVIDFLEIEALRHRPVGTLAYGLQKRVELARALALEPKLLLLDEPMAGMNSEEKEDMARFVLDIHEERGVTVVLIEHDMGVVMDLSHRVAVLDFGRVIAEGPPEEVARDPRVVDAYLGQDHPAAGEAAPAPPAREAERAPP
jgi:branched-chain amino acid transport system ATP-binding protein